MKDRQNKIMTILNSPSILRCPLILNQSANNDNLANNSQDTSAELVDNENNNQDLDDKIIRVTLESRQKNYEGISRSSTKKPLSNRYIPTPFECMALSYDAYKYTKSNTGWIIEPTFPELPPGWKTYAVSECSDSDHDYVGTCYIKYDPDPVAIVFASRDTVATRIGNIIADIQVAFHKVPHHIGYANSFFCEVSRKFDNDPDLEKVNNLVSMTFTGHSLGGVTADFLYLFMAGNGVNELVHSITFDNPGSLRCLENFLLQDPETTPEQAIQFLQIISSGMFNYLAHVNVINTCNEHLGMVLRLVDMPFDYQADKDQPSSKIPVKALVNPYYLWYYSINDQHTKNNIYNYLKGGGKFEVDYNPVGLQFGYIDYLWWERHQRYWEGYSTIIWNRDDFPKDRFNNDKLEWFSDFRKIVNEVRSLAVDNLTELNQKHNQIEVDFSNIEISQFSFFKQKKRSA